MVHYFLQANCAPLTGLRRPLTSVTILTHTCGRILEQSVVRCDEECGQGVQCEAPARRDHTRVCPQPPHAHTRCARYIWWLQILLIILIGVVLQWSAFQLFVWMRGDVVVTSGPVLRRILFRKVSYSLIRSSSSWPQWSNAHLAGSLAVHQCFQVGHHSLATHLLSLSLLDAREYSLSSRARLVSSSSSSPLSLATPTQPQRRCPIMPTMVKLEPVAR